MRRLKLRDRSRRRQAALASAVGVAILAPVIGFELHQTAAGPQTIASSYSVRGAPSVTPTRHRHRHRHPHPVPTPTAVTPTVKPTAVPTTTPPSAPTTTASTPPGGTTGGPPSAVPNAGLPAGTALHAMSGQTISKAGTVIDGADIKGEVTITAYGVVIRNSRISGQGDFGIYVRSGSLVLEDSTVTGFDNSVAGDNYTATRVEVTKANDDGFKIGDNVTIQDSWCHALVVVAGAHSDCGQVQSGVRNAVVRGNWFDVGTGDGNSALFLAPDLGPSSSGPLVVEDNVLGGGNFTVQCVDGNNGEYFISDITIRDNAFIKNSRYGPLRVNVKAAISGNVFLGTRTAISY